MTNKTNFEDKKMNKNTFYKNKNLFNIHDFLINPNINLYCSFPLNTYECLIFYHLQ